MKRKDFDMFLKYKNYFESWLDIPIDKVLQSRGILLSSSEKRKHKPDGWRLYLPVCAFETESALFISCIPDWEDELQSLLRDTSISEAIQKMQKYFHKMFLTCDHHKFYGFKSFNTQIDISHAVAFDITHFEKYLAFYQKIYPRFSELVNPEEQWVLDDFIKTVAKKSHYCVFDNDEIASVAYSENLPNKPHKLTNIAIKTLPEYRRKGYAYIACAAFIHNHLQQGLMPIWECDFSNKASEMLAEKLGFYYMGNVFSASSVSAVDNGK